MSSDNAFSDERTLAAPNRPDISNYLSVGDICDRFRGETCNYTRRDTRGGRKKLLIAPAINWTCAHD